MMGRNENELLSCLCHWSIFLSDKIVSVVLKKGNRAIVENRAIIYIIYENIRS